MGLGRTLIQVCYMHSQILSILTSSYSFTESSESTQSGVTGDEKMGTNSKVLYKSE